MDEWFKKLKDSDPDVRIQAGLTLAYQAGKDPQLAPSVVTALIAALKDPDSNVRGCACNALNTLGKHAVEAYSAVVELIDDPVPFVREAAVNAVANIAEATDNGQVAMPLVLKALKDPEPSVRRSAVMRLRRLKISELIPDLVAVLVDEDATVANEAAMALGGFFKAAQPALPGLVKALGRNGVTASAAGAIGNIGPTKKILPALLAALKDKSARTNIVAAIYQLGPDAVDAVPTLIELLGEKKADVRYNAAMTLGNVGPAAKAAVPALEAALKDKDRSVREEVNKALTKIQG